MDSNRTSGHVEILLPCQTYDPGRGSFMVHPVAVKVHGQPKTIRIGDTRVSVFRAANHIKGHDRNGTAIVETHPEAFDYAVDYSRR